MHRAACFTRYNGSLFTNPGVMELTVNAHTHTHVLTHGAGCSQVKEVGPATNRIQEIDL